MRFLFKSLIRFYRLCLSPLMSPTCRYLPSCSDYAEQAIEKNGAWKGGWLALSRLTRCHPYGAQGYDPVPDLTDIHHPWWAPWRYGRWDGGHITEKFHEKEVSSPMKESGKWDFWIDRGGTFTDIIARSPEGEIKTGKYLSETPLLSKDAALQAIRQTFHLEPSDPIPISRIASLKMGTTLATNALLQKKGEPTFLMITKGFRDALKIGTQARSDIFALNIIKPDSLYIRVSEVSERVRADGSVERPLDGNQAKSLLEDAYQAGLRAVAIVFMHAGRRPGHEVEVAEIARRTGFTQISVSHQTSASMKLISRGETTVVDAYLSPLLRHDVTRLMSELGETGEGTSGCAPRPMFMQSSGGLTSAELFCGKDAILSGPAGGVVAAVKVAKIAGFDKIIAFDMGGTSTDVSHFNGVFEQVFETQVAGVKLCTPMMHIQTVAAGGGSILHFDQNRFQVGPQSAGANPGPKCYRSQGPLTVTDANLIVGKLVPEFFPKVFGTQQNEALDGEAVTAAFEALSNRIADGRSAHQIADGFIRIAVDNMANAIAKISTQRGYDVSDYTLVSFGGAAGQHVCLVAEALGIRRILSHPLSGLLSAYGMGLADVSALREKIIERPLGDPVLEQIRHLKKELMAENRKELAGQGIEANCTRTHMRLLMRYQGTDSPLALIPEELNSVNIKQDFEALHKQRFGFISEDREIMIGSIVVETVGGGGDIGEGDQQLTTAPLPEPLQTHRFFSRSHWHEAAIFRRTDLLPGHIISAPALIVEDHQMLVIEAGWKAEVTPKNHLLIERQDRAQKDSGTSLQADPVMLEIFHNLFMSIAEQMGVTLQNTAQSVNMKERLDFSTALFDKNGHLIANAPHIPVHLGSMDRSVKTIMRDMGSTLRPGDVAMLNAPYNGGTHLPDITVVTPVFDDPGKEILFYLASRGHHADIGGLSPGSMSPRATHIEEEGVYIDSCKLVEGGHFCETSVHARLIGAPYPARNPVQNIADLKAQVAANQKGIRELKKMLAHYGRDLVEAYMGHVQDHAESQVRAVIAGLEDAEFKIEMDQGCEIAVALHVDKKARTLQIDFTGTSAEQANNFNAPEPVTRAAVLYVFRCLIEDNIPLNAGCMRPIEITIPEDSMLSPRYPAAVAAGNVETSQVVTNALFAALGVLGSAQGTMNNLTFGNDQLQYYETLCSGAPAGPGFDGSDAVHTHMTNSHLTDPEILEQRFPVVIENFAICPGSGGRGKWSAGDGTIREIRFLETMSCAILSGFRKIPPFGTKGGEPGKVGENKLYRKDGSIETLESSTEIILHEGDRIMIRTPTGGGFGPSQETEV